MGCFNERCDLTRLVIREVDKVVVVEISGPTPKPDDWAFELDGYSLLQLIFNQIDRDAMIRNGHKPSYRLSREVITLRSGRYDDYGGIIYLEEGEKKSWRPRQQGSRPRRDLHCMIHARAYEAAAKESELSREIPEGTSPELIKLAKVASFAAAAGVRLLNPARVHSGQGKNSWISEASAKLTAITEWQMDKQTREELKKLRSTKR